MTEFLYFLVNCPFNDLKKQEEEMLDKHGVWFYVPLVCVESFCHLYIVCKTPIFIWFIIFSICKCSYVVFNFKIAVSCTPQTSFLKLWCAQMMDQRHVQDTRKSYQSRCKCIYGLVSDIWRTDAEKWGML